jgi:hypothetical protein
MDRFGHLEHVGQLARRLILNLLGIAVILDAVASPGTHTGELATGLILLGLAPLDVLAAALEERIRRPPRRPF